MKKTTLSTLGKIMIGAILSFLLSSIFLYIGERQTIANIMPSWNDEDFYWQQIKAVLHYGQPLGYYGYDGSHAIIGNFGFHGFVILLPYILFCAVFGLQFNSIALANMILVSISIAVYCLLYRPGLKRLFVFSVYIFSPMLLFYINTGMMEGENYFFAITIALLMVYIKNNQAGKKATIVLGILIVWALFSKVTWTLFIFPYVLIILKNKTKLPALCKCVIAALITMFSGIVGYSAFLLCSADYFKGSSLIEAYINIVYTEGLLQGIVFIFKNIFENIVSTWFKFDSPWICVCGLFVIGILIIAVWFFVFGRGDLFYGIPILVMAGYIIGVAFLYAGGGAAVRTVYPAAVFAQVFILVILFDLEMSKIHWGTYMLSFIFFFAGFILQYKGDYDYRTYYVRENIPLYEEIEKYMANIEVDALAASPWENTLVMAINSYPETIYELFMPTGIGINYYRDIPQVLTEFKAKYILLSNDNLEDLEFLKEAGYIIIDNDNRTTLLKRNVVVDNGLQ